MHEENLYLIKFILKNVHLRQLDDINEFIPLDFVKNILALRSETDKTLAE